MKRPNSCMAWIEDAQKHQVGLESKSWASHHSLSRQRGINYLLSVAAGP